MRPTLLLLTLMCFALVSFGQEKETVEKRRERLKRERRNKTIGNNSSTIYREYGFNTSAILQSIPILPLGRESDANYVFFFKRRKNNKNKMFRFHIAGSVGGNDFSLTSFELKLGMEYVRPLTGGWEYYYGYDFLTFIINSGNDAGIGFGPIFGMKYNLNDFITFGTEGSGYFTISGGNSTTDLAINLRPLNGLFISFKLYK